MENAIGNFFGYLFQSLMLCAFISLIATWYFHGKLISYLSKNKPEICEEFFSFSAWLSLDSISNIFEKKFYLFSGEWKDQDLETKKYIRNSKTAFTIFYIFIAMIVISTFLFVAIFAQISSVK